MNQKQPQPILKILLADDDIDDCFFFDKALNEIPIATQLTKVHDGEELMNHLSANLGNLPDILFLDLSMPRKTGFECLSDIKENNKLDGIYIVMFSTFHAQNSIYNQDMINFLLKIGANDYIKKADEFVKLKQTIQKTLFQALKR